jgi:hypothetical protein
LIIALILSGCGNRIQNKEKIQEAIISRLQSRSGLDLNSLDITTTSVSFEKNMAYATVAFHTKGDRAVNSGMEMKYTLEARDGKWIVVKAASPQGHAMMGNPPAGDKLPPGHPPISGDPHATTPGQGADGRAQ